MKGLVESRINFLKQIKLLIGAIIIIHLSFISGKSQWNVQNTGTSINLNKIQFVNSETGWAAGFQAIPVQIALIKTTDSGINWTGQYQNLPAGNRIISLFFLNENTGWIAGADGLFKTTNGGANYFTLNSPSIVTYECYFVNALTGWAVGLTGSDGKVNKTTDGGASWLTQTINIQQYEQLYSVHFENHLTGWCAGSSSIIKTTDGGITWITQQHPYCTDIKTIFALSSDIVWAAAGFGAVLSTTNGGAEWVLKSTGTNHNVNSVFFTDANTGYAVTLQAEILKTTNNGNNWILQLFDTSAIRLNSVFFTSAETGFVSGGQGKIYKTINAGGTNIRIISSSIPSEYNLYPNYPNPFNSETVIKFDIAGNKLNDVKIEVYDTSGRMISETFNERLKGGTYEITFNGSSLSSGTYFYRMTAGDFSQTKKMLLVK